MRDDDFIVEGRVVSSGGGDLLIEFEMPDEGYEPFTGVSLLDEAFFKMMADLQENSLYTLANRFKGNSQSYPEYFQQLQPPSRLAPLNKLNGNFPYTGGEVNNYEVQPGDTLWEIAQKFHTDVDTLATLNKIKNIHEIEAGQQLKIRMDDILSPGNKLPSTNTSTTVNSEGWTRMLVSDGPFVSGIAESISEGNKKGANAPTTPGTMIFEGGQYFKVQDDGKPYPIKDPEPRTIFWSRGKYWRLGEDGEHYYVGEVAIVNTSNGAIGSTPGYMTASVKCINFIADYEDFEPMPYRVSPNDPKTIGYGHVIQPGEDYSGGISKEVAKSLLLRQVNEEYAPIVNRWATANNVSLNQQQFDALVSFVYNMGGINDDDTPTLARVLKNSKATPEQIKQAFGLYRFGADGPLEGLVARRRDEADMFLYGDYRRK